MITVSISVDQKEIQLNINAGSTVSKALQSAGITLGAKDKVTPELSAILKDGNQVRVIRVKEEYYVEQVIIPFEHQELRNEALAEGDRRLSQPGVNGLKEITYQRVYEDGVEISNAIVKSTIIKAAMPELEMVGSRSQLTPIQIPGTIAYLSAGNAWIMENDTSNRQLVISTADLDGRIFSLSADGRFLLFTRFSNDANQINSLWMAALHEDPIQIIDLGVRNVVHYAEFNSTFNDLAYSTVEWREASPGWQANNDLNVLGISPDGSPTSPQQELGPNSGGVYGWWGTEFAWSPDQLRFLYSRPDSIGIIDRKARTQFTIQTISPFQTGSNWAWVPGAAWSPDGSVVYAVSHTVSEASPDASQQFDLIAIPLRGGSTMRLVENVGMFAHPMPSPATEVIGLVNPSTGNSVEQAGYNVAYLQAVFPDQSETSKYRLYVMDRDGSNRYALFPDESAPGLEPQRVVWSPVELGEDGNYAIAVVYNGNIWIIDANTGAAQQVTGDGLTNRIDWR